MNKAEQGMEGLNGLANILPSEGSEWRLYVREWQHAGTEDDTTAEDLNCKEEIVADLEQPITHN